jgi:hypothetical protein
MDIQWLEPWHAIGASKDASEVELSREVAKGHPLCGINVTAIGLGLDGDDVLFQLNDGSGRVAVVHLTWRGQREEDPGWPHTVLYPSIQDWIERGMKADNAEFVARAAEFARVAEYVLKKNEELYRRLSAGPSDGA